MKARKTARRRPFRLPSRRQRYIFYAVGISVLLLFNIWAANNAFRANLVRVPYSPFFVQQIRDGNVESITSTGTAIQGRLKHAVKPAAGEKAALDFSTEIPSFKRMSWRQLDLAAGSGSWGSSARRETPRLTSFSISTL